MAPEAHDANIPNAGRVRKFFLGPPVTSDYDCGTNVSPDVVAARELVTETWEVGPGGVRRDPE